MLGHLKSTSGVAGGDRYARLPDSKGSLRDDRLEISGDALP